MEPYETQEEEVLALQQWWQENRLFIVGAVTALLAGSGGWTFWQDWSSGQSAEASAAWSVLLDSVQQASENTIDSGERDELRQQAETLAEMRGAGLYADYAQLLLARFALERDDLAAASARLEGLQGGFWPWPSTERQAVERTASLLLVRIDMAEGEYERALARLGSLGETGTEVTDLRGEILFAQNRREAAAEAWRSVAASEESQMLANLARLKLMQVERIPSFVDAQPEPGEVAE